MKIELRAVTIAELVDGFADNGEQGVTGYGGDLNIRPAYQREFVYGPKERDAVIETVRKGFPLNTMYWAVADDGFELMDGQQRTVSLCQYVNGEFSVEIDGNPFSFHNLPKERQQRILDYELSIYVCDGSDEDKLEWFKVINIAGLELKPQELRNAIYTGPWLSDAKRWFSRRNPPAVQEDRHKLVSADPNRQEVLEIALDWFTGGKIEEYMDGHRSDADAQELWDYWQAVFDWVKRVFPNQDSARAKLMKGLPWGRFYNSHKDDKLNAAELEKRIVALIDDDEVENKKGIYAYLLTDNEKTLNLRAFDEKTKQSVYARQKGICPVCNKHFEFHEMEADHRIPWHKGGKTTADNCDMLCVADNRAKGGK
ncbi:MAG: DUF262 domain-containing protein [Parasphingopyxis sp.]|uniref:HNH endonuclease family protein n=1 Tax=Parasphingopyxis sp. TaxID=1920299 RepID=UPI0032EEE1B8